MDSIFNQRPPSLLSQFLSSPLRFLAHFLYTAFPLPPPTRTGKSIRLVCISDTHSAHLDLPPLPPGDVLIHSGDLTQSGTLNEFYGVLDWMRIQPFKHKIFIAGNHDKCLDDPTIYQVLDGQYPELIYLQDSSVNVSVRGRILTVYGSPRTPQHGSWSFQYPRFDPSQPIPVPPISIPMTSSSSSYLPRSKSTTPTISRGFSSLSASADVNPWHFIPAKTDILITHGPPFAHLDSLMPSSPQGCAALLNALWLPPPPLAHVFGHIHARGVQVLSWENDQRYYENIMAGRVGWWSLLLVLWGTVKRMYAFGKGRREMAKEGTVLVNAASVGGWGDERRNEAVCVDV
ncbi:Metallo-dependent phosphatase-like protein [Crucibulum laeve]|uniref:Metallo-dependent phosphatase-like protein n=1 Tax=Crucibulum laeve TaxID=68775 RepID=A0A5C3LFE6_9AGAR|nr:Metallo-dependent phosphatase-like protein [Crucibulum laeve]